MRFLSCPVKSPSVLLANAQSLRPKMDELAAVASVLKPNVIAVCESWLSDRVSDTEIRLSGYSSYRCDRSNGKKGGGVCVYVECTLCCEEWSSKPSSCPFLENVTLILKQLNVILIVIYVPPGLSSANYHDIADYLVGIVDEATAAFPDLMTIVAGDMNQFPTKVIELNLGVRQIVDVPTRGMTVLDKFLVDQRILSSLTADDEKTLKNPQLFSVYPPLGNSDHRSVFLKPINMPNKGFQLKKVFDFRASHMHRFRVCLANYPWHSFYRSDSSVDDKCNLLHTIIESAMSTFPISYVKLSSKDKAWMTPAIKSLINRRYEAFRFKRYDLFHHYKLKVKEMIHKAKQNWANECCKSKTAIWSMVRNTSNKGKDNSLQSLIQTYNSVDSAANAINSKLSESFTKPPDRNDIRSKFSSHNSQHWKPDVTIKLVRDILFNLPLGKASGSDNLPARVLKEAAEELSGPLAHVLALSFEAAVVPRRWKIAKVVPVPKKNNPTVDDLRPLSMLPLFSKIMEKIALESIKPTLLSMYGDSQFGFRPGYSTTHAHVRIHDFITLSLNNKHTKAVVMISFDMKKAFDSLNHKNLIVSLNTGNLPAHFIKWCVSFLQDRSQFVCLNQGIFSKSLNVSSGIPQGSVLAPFLFAAHMGSLVPHSSATCMIKYADDVVCLFPLLDDDDLEESVRNELAHVDSWCNSNGLQLNVSKTKVLIISNAKRKFSLVNVNITQCTQIKILGLTYTDNLKWDTHVDNIIKKASRQIYILKKLRPYVCPSLLVQIYNAIILSSLEYCAPVMVGINMKNSEKLERIRRRCHRLICGCESECGMLQPLSTRRLQQATRLFIQLTNPENLLNNIMPRRLPRSQHYMIHPIRTSTRIQSFIPFMTLHINSTTKRSSTFRN